MYDTSRKERTGEVYVEDSKRMGIRAQGRGEEEGSNIGVEGMKQRERSRRGGGGQSRGAGKG